MFARSSMRWLVQAALVAGASEGAFGQEVEAEAESEDEVIVYPDMPDGRPPTRAVEGATVAEADAMASYVEPIPGSEASFEMLPIPAGSFLMGSPDDEDGREDDEGPQRRVEVAPFWMGRCEVTWDEYHLFMLRLDLRRRSQGAEQTVENDRWADAVSRPTPPYVPMDFEMGVSGYPAICMTQFAAKQYTKWLSMKTGRFYRLPTEAEWEYACRAGTTTAYSFGDDLDDLDDYAWHFDNADDSYQKVGSKKPNPWGLHDMHGNVSEWVLDGYSEQYALTANAPMVAPLHWPTEMYPRVVRGGSWDDDPERLRSAARRKSRKSWKVQDPQLPKSIWYHTDATFVGFRVVRPLTPPESDEERERFWKADLDDVREIQERQRRGGR